MDLPDPPSTLDTESLGDFLRDLLPFYDGTERMHLQRIVWDFAGWDPVDKSERNTVGVDRGVLRDWRKAVRDADYAEGDSRTHEGATEDLADIAAEMDDHL